MRKNFIFYHMFCVNDAQFRFERTYRKLKISGLLSQCDRLILVLVGKYKEEYRKQIDNLIHDDKIEFLFSKDESSEASTINLIYEISNKEYCNILYLHSKGVTRPHLTPQ